MEAGAQSLKNLYANVANLTLYIENKESHLASLSTSTEGISRVKQYISLAALQCNDSKAWKPSLLVKLPQIGNAYVTEGKIILKYRSKSIWRSKNRLHFNKFNLLVFDRILVKMSSVCLKLQTFLSGGLIGATRCEAAVSAG